MANRDVRPGAPAATPLVEPVVVPANDNERPTCDDCAAAGRTCRFHVGWAAGWDACAEIVALVVACPDAVEVLG